MSAPNPTHSKTQSKQCPDCGRTAFEADSQFCAACGMRIELKPLRMGSLAAEFFGALGSFEFPMLRTLRDLMRGPGSVATAWIDGARIRYASPLKFLIIVGVVIALTHFPMLGLREYFTIPGQAQYNVGLGHQFPQYFAPFCFVLMAPIGLLLGVLSSRFGIPRRGLEWYLLGLYCCGLSAILQLVLRLGAALSRSTSITQSLSYVEFCVPALVLCWGAWGFVKRRFIGVALMAWTITLFTGVFAGAFVLLSR